MPDKPQIFLWLGLTLEDYNIEDYNNLMATLEIYNNPKLHEKLLQGMEE